MVDEEPCCLGALDQTLPLAPVPMRVSDEEATPPERVLTKLFRFPPLEAWLLLL